MRISAMTLVWTMALSSSVGCGRDHDAKDDHDKTAVKEDAGSDVAPIDGEEEEVDPIEVPDAGVDAARPEPFPGCPRESISELFGGGETTFTVADLQACEALCGDDGACKNAMCEGFSAYISCVVSEEQKCSTDRGGACRTEFEDTSCCIGAAGCLNEEDDQAYFECAMANCERENTATWDCAAADEACVGAFSYPRSSACLAVGP